MKFEIGDRVKVKKYEGHVNKEHLKELIERNHIFSIKHIETINNMNWYDIIENNCVWSFKEEELELEEKYKVGDLVQLVKESPCYFSNNMERFLGSIQIIKDINNNKVTFEEEETHIYNFALSCIEKKINLKVGDKVLFKNKMGNGWCDSMKKYKNTIQTIKEIVELPYECYDNFFIFSDECIFRTTDIERIVKEEPIVKYDIKKEDYICSLNSAIKENIKYIKNNMEEKEMEILRIYKNRKQNYLFEKFKKEEEEFLNNDRIKNVIERAEEELNLLLERDENNKFKFEPIGIIEPTTKTLIDKARKDYERQMDELEELIDEVEAQLELDCCYETKIEILKKYNILDEEGKIADVESKIVNCNATTVEEPKKKRGLGKRK